MATVSHFAAPRDGEASFWFAYDQKPTKVATLSQFAASKGRRGLILFCFRTRPLRWASQEPTNVATVSLLAAPMDGEACLWFAYGIAPVGLLGTREPCGNFAIRNLQGRRGFTLVSV